jgi:hypothetical protein
MSGMADDDKSLRRMQMVADIANKRADTALKEEQRRWEPWKALSAAFGAGVAVTTGLFALMAWLVGHLH